MFKILKKSLKTGIVTGQYPRPPAGAKFICHAHGAAEGPTVSKIPDHP